MVSGDTNGATDIFIRDREAKQTTRVSVASDGTQANGDSYSPAISADGRFVSFYSDASNLVPGDTNRFGDIFVHDRETGRTIRVNISSGGVQANAITRQGSAISVNGRFVAFSSEAGNLVEGDKYWFCDVFVHDCNNGQTTRASVSSNGKPGYGESTALAMSADGRWVAFRSAASNLVEGDTNGYPDIFLHDRQSKQTTRVSISSSGEQAKRSSAYPSISENGRWISFSSQATNLVSGITNAVRNVFVRDRVIGKTTCASVSVSGKAANANCLGSRISAKGRFVVFSSRASNLVTNDTNRCADIFIRDREGD